MLSLGFALVVAAAIAFVFRSTRPIGIVCIAFIAFLFPWVTCGLIALAALVFALFLFYTPNP